MFTTPTKGEGDLGKGREKKLIIIVETGRYFWLNESLIWG